MKRVNLLLVFTEFSFGFSYNRMVEKVHDTLYKHSYHSHHYYSNAFNFLPFRDVINPDKSYRFLFLVDFESAGENPA